MIKRTPDWSPILCPGVGVTRKLHELASYLTRVRGVDVDPHARELLLDAELRQWLADVDEYRQINHARFRGSRRKINGSGGWLKNLHPETIKVKTKTHKRKRAHAR